MKDIAGGVHVRVPELAAPNALKSALRGAVSGIVVKYAGGQLRISGLSRPLSLWDSYGLSGYKLGTATLSEDARGRW